MQLLNENDAPDWLREEDRARRRHAVVVARWQGLGPAAVVADATSGCKRAQKVRGQGGGAPQSLGRAPQSMLGGGKSLEHYYFIRNGKTFFGRKDVPLAAECKTE